MELNEKGLRERKWWTERGYKLPEFDRKAVRRPPGGDRSGSILVPEIFSGHFRPGQSRSFWTRGSWTGGLWPPRATIRRSWKG